MHCVRCYGASPAVTHSKIELFIVLSKFTFLSGCIQRPRPRVKSRACETGINISIWHAARERDSAGNTESDVCYHHVMGWGHQGVHDGDTQEMRGDTQRLSPGVTSAPHGNYGCSLWQWWPGVWPPGAGHMSPDVTPLSRVPCSAQYLTVSPSLVTPLPGDTCQSRDPRCLKRGEPTITHSTPSGLLMSWLCKNHESSQLWMLCLWSLGGVMMQWSHSSWAAHSPHVTTSHSQCWDRGGTKNGITYHYGDGDIPQREI